jgi:hypothetical protein
VHSFIKFGNKGGEMIYEDCKHHIGNGICDIFPESLEECPEDCKYYDEEDYEDEEEK